MLERCFIRSPVARSGVALTLLLLAAACGGGGPRPLQSDAERRASQTPAPASPLEPIRIGTSGDYPPFSLDGVGFDVDLAHAMAEDLDLEIQWVTFRWPELGKDIATQRFDLAMSGVTWRAQRAVEGEMSRAIAQGGPCLVGATSPRRLAVNRGGILERFARDHYEGASILATEDNRSLPDLLAEGRVDAFLTDSFELPHFRREPWDVHCHPPTDRKVYWVSRGRVEDLAPRIDRWIASHEDAIRALRRKHFGTSQPRDEIDHLVDLLSRRLELMPWVAAYKREHDLPIEDRERERVVLESAVRAAREHRLETAGIEALFAQQIELAKAVQRRSVAARAELDLATELRPTLLRLGERILDTLERCAPFETSRLTPDRMLLLSPLLEPFEREQLRRALLEIRPATSDRGTSSSSSRPPCLPAPP